MMTFKKYAKPLMSRLNNKVNIKKCVKNSTKRDCRNQMQTDKKNVIIIG